MLMFMKKMRKNKKGFTLTELIVVVAILGVLAAVATPMISGQLATARTNADAATAKVIESAVSQAVAAGEITTNADGTLVAGTNTARNTIRTEVASRLTGNTIPTPRTASTVFVLTGTGGCSAATAPATQSATQINLNATE